MDFFGVVGVIANAFQFINFVESVISKVRELRQFASGTLAEYNDLEKIIIDLSILSGRLQLSERLTDPVLDSLCSLCVEMAGELGVALEALDMKKNCSRSQTWRAAIRSVWSKEKPQALERRVGRLPPSVELTCYCELRIIDVGI